MRRLSLVCAALLAAGCGYIGSKRAAAPDTPAWAETETPPPPAFHLDKLVRVDVNARNSLRYGVDPAAMSIGPDGVVRYVMVAQSGGAMTAMYEGIRCSTADYKVYARYNDGRWTSVESPEWRSLYAQSRMQYPLAFARQGGCDGKAQPTSVQQIVERLRSTSLSDDSP